MTKDQLSRLQPGDLVRHKHSADAMIVHANYGSHCIAIRCSHVSNPIEWDIVDAGGQVISTD